MLTGVVDEYVESTVRAVNALCQTMDRAPVTEVQLFVCHSLVAARICIHTPINHTPPITQSINQSHNCYSGPTNKTLPVADLEGGGTEAVMVLLISDNGTVSWRRHRQL